MVNFIIYSSSNCPHVSPFDKKSIKTSGYSSKHAKIEITEEAKMKFVFALLVLVPFVMANPVDKRWLVSVSQLVSLLENSLGITPDTELSSCNSICQANAGFLAAFCGTACSTIINAAHSG